MLDPAPVAPAVVCANVVLNEAGALLLVRESKASALGRWSLPAGRLEAGESLRHAAGREALEETGLTVAVGPLLGIYHCPATLEGGAAVVFAFRSEVTGGELTPSPEHPDVEFVSRARVDELMRSHLIRGQHVGLALAAADSGAELPADLVVQVSASPTPTAGHRVD